MLCLFGEKSWVVPEPFLSYYSRLSRCDCYTEFTQNKEFFQPTLLRKKLTHILSLSENHLLTAVSNILLVCLSKSESRLIYSK